MDIPERPFENIISINDSLLEDPIKGLITLNELDRNIYREGRRLESIVLLSGMNEYNRWVYVSLILDDLLYQYQISCRKARELDSSILAYKKALLLKKAVSEVIDVIGIRLKIKFDSNYIEDRKQGYFTTGWGRFENTTNNTLELGETELMEYYNDLNTGRIDKYLKNCDMRFGRKFEDEKLLKIFQHLKEEKYIDEDTEKDNFFYLLGNREEIPRNFTRINWIASLKSLNSWIQVFYGSENRKWKKTSECFVNQCNEIKERSITTAVDKNDNVLKEEELFRRWLVEK